MCLQAHSMWTALVHPPSFLQVDNRYILPNGQHLDTLIQEGGAPPLQFLQFVQDSVGKKTWADAEWAKLLPVDLRVDTATGKTDKRKCLNGDVLQQAMDFIRDQHGVTSDSRCPFRIGSTFAYDKLCFEASVDSESWAPLHTDWAAVDNTLSRRGFGIVSRRVFHMSECQDLIFPINVKNAYGLQTFRDRSISSSLAFYWHSKKVGAPPLCPSRLTKRRTYRPRSVIYRYVSRQSSEKKMI
jgi:hypothetical protein